jgi:dimethylamine monooxygenase subunit A
MALGFTVEDLAGRAWMGGVRSMGLTRVAPDEWLWRDFDRDARQAVFDAHPDAVQILPEGEAAAKEAAQLVAGTDDLGQAARQAWEDLCVLADDGQGHYRLVAGALGFPTHWFLEQKIGQVMDMIHVPIPGYAEQLSDGVNHFFRTLPVGQIFGRSNWFVVSSNDWRYRPGNDAVQRFAHVTADNAGQTLFVRSERQTLRRLPETGAMLFTIGIALEPIANISAALVARIAEATRVMADAEVKRRGNDHLLTVLESYAAWRTTPAQT